MPSIEDASQTVAGKARDARSASASSSLIRKVREGYIGSRQGRRFEGGRTRHMKLPILGALGSAILRSLLLR